jgi:hypothetical protein
MRILTDKPQKRPTPFDLADFICLAQGEEIVQTVMKMTGKL